MKVIRYSEFEIYIRDCTIFVETMRGRQGILTFEEPSSSSGRYCLYKWYNEGKFPSCIDTIRDNGSTSMHRLKVVGIDEV